MNALAEKFETYETDLREIKTSVNLANEQDQEATENAKMAVKKAESLEQQNEQLNPGTFSCENIHFKISKIPTSLFMEIKKRRGSKLFNSCTPCIHYET